MAKRSKEQVAKDELRTVMELQSQARVGIDQLAGKLGFSGPKLRRIIKNLEDDQTIWGYHAVTDYTSIGLEEYLILIRKTSESLEQAMEKIVSREFEQRASKMGVMIGSSYYLHGLYDWVICFTAKDLKQAKRFEAELLKTYKGIIGETQLLEVLFPVKRSGIQNPSVEELSLIHI